MRNRSGINPIDTATDDTETNVQAALEAFKEARKNRLGLDVIINKIASLCMIEGVYNVNVVQPAANIVAAPEKYTRCTGITITVTGTHDE